MKNKICSTITYTKTFFIIFKNKNPLKIFLLFLIININIFGQNPVNLIPDYSIEHINCDFSNSNDWDAYNAYTFGPFGICDIIISDYLKRYKGCENGTWDKIYLDRRVPDNYFGMQDSYNGESYAGIVTCDVSCGGLGTWTHKTGRIIIKLKEIMDKEKKYLFILHVSKMDYSTKNPKYEIHVSKGPNLFFYKSDLIKEGEIYNSDAWITITKENYLPNTDGYKYLIIKCKRNWFRYNFNIAGFYFDDIFLGEQCLYEDPCSRGLGPISASKPNYINDDEHYPICVNVSKNVLEVYDINIFNEAGQLEVQLPDVSCLNGINFPICWDGKLEGGSEVSAGVYTWQMKYKNDCYEKTDYAEKFIKQEIRIIYDAPSHEPCNNSVKTPLPCCADEPDIFIDDVELKGPGKIEYVAYNNITTEDVTIRSDVDNALFQAGNKIILKEGLVTEPGANVRFIVHPCTPVSRTGATVDNNSLKSTLINNNIDIINQPENNIDQNNGNHFNNDSIYVTTDNTIIDLYPNPCNGRFSININRPSNDMIIQVIDAKGHIIMEIKNIRNKTNYIDISGMGAGLYMVKLNTGSQVITKKLIYQ